MLSTDCLREWLRIRLDFLHSQNASTSAVKHFTDEWILLDRLVGGQLQRFTVESVVELLDAHINDVLTRGGDLAQCLIDAVSRIDVGK